MNPPPLKKLEKEAFKCVNCGEGVHASSPLGSMRQAIGALADDSTRAQQRHTAHGTNGAHVSEGEGGRGGAPSSPSSSSPSPSSRYSVHLNI